MVKSKYLLISGNLIVSSKIVYDKCGKHHIVKASMPKHTFTFAIQFSSPVFCLFLRRCMDESLKKDIIKVQKMCTSGKSTTPALASASNEMAALWDPLLGASRMSVISWITSDALYFILKIFIYVTNPINYQIVKFMLPDHIM